MKLLFRILRIIGVVFLVFTVIYFIRLFFYLYKSYEFTNYGYGILTGNIILFVIGILLIYFSNKRLNNES
jgi:hypothetical protein